MSRTTLALAAAAALLGAYVLLVAPLEEKREGIKEKLFVEHRSMVKHERFISSARDTEVDIEKAAKELEEMEQFIIKESDLSLAFASLQSKVQDMAESAGLRITSIKPLQAVGYEGYRGLPIFMDCTGGMGQLSDFLNYLDSSWEFIAIDRLGISVLPRGELRVKIQLSGLTKA